MTWFTDHQALKSLRTALANSSRRVHWRETQDNFPFHVDYRRGFTMHVDGLTRHSSWPDRSKVYMLKGHINRTDGNTSKFFVYLNTKYHADLASLVA